MTTAFDLGHIDSLVFFFSFSIIPFDDGTNFIVIDVVYASFDPITSYELRDNIRYLVEEVETARIANSQTASSKTIR
jgi:hypothetical protein